MTTCMSHSNYLSPPHTSQDQSALTHSAFLQALVLLYYTIRFYLLCPLGQGCQQVADVILGTGRLLAFGPNAS
jgi:hypothetical protein